MKEKSEVNRLNYALAKHHCEMLREKIDPRLIEQIQVAENPSLNYRRAFESVYHDELEKTISLQEERRQLERTKNHPYPNQSPLGRSKSNPYLFAPLTLQNATDHKSPTQLGQKKQRERFTDYDEERSKKLDDLINKNCSGSFLFKEQDDYQKRKYQESLLAKRMLQQQLLTKENQKIQKMENHNLEVEQFKRNRAQQVALDLDLSQEKKKENRLFGDEIKQQMQVQRTKKGRKSYFNYQHVARHNPITNPIEYHIDNPYILSQYQANAYHYQ